MSLKSSPRMKRSLLETPKKRNSQNNNNINFYPPYEPKIKREEIAKRKLERIDTKMFNSKLSPRKEVNINIEDMVNAIYELSTTIGDLNSVISSIKKLSASISYETYKYDNIVTLSNSSKKCPPDVLLYTLSIAAAMITSDNPLEKHVHDNFLMLATDLCKSKEQYETFNDQTFPRKRAENILEIIKNANCNYKIRSVVNFLDKDLCNNPESYSEKKAQTPTTAELLKKYDFETFLKIGANNSIFITKEELNKYLGIRDKFFMKWETAFQGVHYIWDRSKVDNSFSLSIMISVISREFVNFVYIGIKELTENN